MVLPAIPGMKWCGPVCGPALVPLSHAVWTIDHIYPVGARGFLDQLPAAPIALRRFRRHAHCSKKAGTKKGVRRFICTSRWCWSLPTKAADMDPAFEKAFNAGDLDTLLKLYNEHGPVQAFSAALFAQSTLFVRTR